MRSQNNLRKHGTDDNDDNDGFDSAADISAHIHKLQIGHFIVKKKVYFLKRYFLQVQSAETHTAWDINISTAVI